MLSFGRLALDRVQTVVADGRWGSGEWRFVMPTVRAQ
jgi:hypothetical protein